MSRLGHKSANRVYAEELGVSMRLVWKLGGAERLKRLDEGARNLLLRDSTWGHGIRRGRRNTQIPAPKPE